MAYGRLFASASASAPKARPKFSDAKKAQSTRRRQPRPRRSGEVGVSGAWIGALRATAAVVGRVDANREQADYCPTARISAPDLRGKPQKHEDPPDRRAGVPANQQWLALEGAADVKRLRLYRSFARHRPANSSKSEKPTGTPNQDFSSFNGAHETGVRTLGNTAGGLQSGTRARPLFGSA